MSEQLRIAGNIQSYMLGDWLYLRPLLQLEHCSESSANNAFLDAIASSSTYPCQSVGEWVIDSFRLEIAITSPSFASLLFLNRSNFVKETPHFFI